jgi:hypothetical protein
VRHQEPRDIGLCKGRRRAKDQLGSGDRCTYIVGDKFESRFMPPAKIMERDGAAGGTMGGNGGIVATPQPNPMASERQIAGRGEGPIATAQHSDFHGSALPCIGFAPADPATQVDAAP